MFFADIVGLSGSPPDAEIPSLTLLNGYTARLVAAERAEPARGLAAHRAVRPAAGAHGRPARPDQLLRRERVRQRRDHAVPQRRPGQQPDARAGSNGTGVAAEFDPKNGLRLKFGLQQSNTDATNLSDSMYTLSEVGYTFTPFALPEGTYRVWFRTDNTADDHPRTGVGVSLDQKLTARSACSAGTARRNCDLRPRPLLQRRHRLPERPRLQPAGYLGRRLCRRWIWRRGRSEKLTEGYYNFQLTERLRLSFHLTHVLDTPAAATGSATSCRACGSRRRFRAICQE